MKKFEHGGNVYTADGLKENWLDFSANINPLGMSEAVKSAIVDNIDGLIHYPDPNALELKFAISSKYKINLENIITLNGAAEFFYLFFNIIRPQRVLIAIPSFSEYERAALSANCEVQYFKTHAENNFEVNFDELTETIIKNKIDCVVLANPNNPTGTVIKLRDVEKLFDITDFIMVDESFIDFADIESTRNLVNDNKKLIVVQSMTKFFAIPGLRLGFAVADEELIKIFELGKDVWNVNYLAQKVGVTALKDEIYYNKTRQWIDEEKKFVVDRLNGINNIKIFKPAVNFVLIKFETEEIAFDLLNYLRRKNILIRSCANFAGLDGSYLRMAIRKREENNKIIDLIDSFLKGQIL